MVVFIAAFYDPVLTLLSSKRFNVIMYLLFPFNIQI